MHFKKNIFIAVIEMCILSSQVHGKCVRYSQRNNEEFCEAAEGSHKADNNVSNIVENDMKTTTLSQISSRTDENGTCSSEYDLENKLFKIAIENLSDIHRLTSLSQVQAHLSHNRKDDNTTITFTKHGETKDLNKIIKKRSAVELKTILPHKQNSKRHKKSKHLKVKKHSYFKY